MMVDITSFVKTHEKLLLWNPDNCMYLKVHYVGTTYQVGGKDINSKASVLISSDVLFGWKGLVGARMLLLH